MPKGKKTYVKYTSPVGVAVYPKLDKAYQWDDASERSLPNPDGQMETRLSVSIKDAQEFKNTIDAAVKDSGIKAKHKCYEVNEEDGTIVFKHKAYGKTKEGEPNKIKFFDSAGNPIKGTVRVTGGSRIRLMGWISVSKMGERLNIRGCQIIDLAEDNEGFEAYSGGSFKASDLNDDDDVEDEKNVNEAEETADDEDEF